MADGRSGAVAIIQRFAGARVRRCGDPPEEVESSTLGRCHARHHGVDLRAGIAVAAGQRDRLERLCRYALRPPVAEDRLRRAADGQVWFALRHRREVVEYTPSGEGRDVAVTETPRADDGNGAVPSRVLRVRRRSCPEDPDLRGEDDLTFDPCS